MITDVIKRPEDIVTQILLVKMLSINVALEGVILLGREIEDGIPLNSFLPGIYRCLCGVHFL